MIALIQDPRYKEIDKDEKGRKKDSREVMMN